jgi:hypothetical protein
MISPIDLTKIGYPRYEPPKYSKWRVHIAPSSGLTITPLQGEEPCWFHRQMQQLFFGFKWEKVD